MNTHIKSSGRENGNVRASVVFSMVFFCVMGASFLLADGPCGSCATPQGNQFQYQPGCVAPKCDGVSACRIVWHPNYYSGPCLFNCVSVIKCKQVTLVSTLTVQDGTCNGDCACNLGGLPYTQQSVQVTVTAQDGSCLG
jgi:hypothetical protein